MEDYNEENEGAIHALTLMLPEQAWDTLESFKYSPFGILQLPLSYTPSQAAMAISLLARLVADPPVPDDKISKLRPPLDFMFEEEEIKRNDRKRLAEAVAFIHEIAGCSDISVKCDVDKDTAKPNLQLTLLLREDQVKRLVDLKSQYIREISARNVAALKGEENFSPEELRGIQRIPEMILNDMMRNRPMDEAATANYLQLAQAGITLMLKSRGQFEQGGKSAIDLIEQLSPQCRNRCRAIVSNFLKEAPEFLGNAPNLQGFAKTLSDVTLMMDAGNIPCVQRYMEGMLAAITPEISRKIRDISPFPGSR